MRAHPTVAAVLAAALLGTVSAVGPPSVEAALAGAETAAARAAPEDDRLQIALERIHAEAAEFFTPDYYGISVVRLSDGDLASVDGSGKDNWHISLSAAKVIWVAVATGEVGAAAVEPYASDIFRKSSNSAASRVIGLLVPPGAAGPPYHEGVNTVNATMWDWGMSESYTYAWFDPGMSDYEYHRSSVWKPAFPNHCCVKVWWTNNFTTTDDLAGFWAMLGNGEILDEADTAQVLEWARLPRWLDNITNEIVINRLPAAVADDVAHKTGWNDSRTRRIAGGLVTTPSGEQYAIAIAFRTEYEHEFWGGGLDWARYASCEIYALEAGTDHECTRSGDPYSIVHHTTTPIGKLSAASADRTEVTVAGWALDRDAGPDPIDVRITVDGAPVGTVTADRLKAWVHDRHRMGNYHGFNATLPVDLSPGPHRVCAIGLNDSTRGSNRSLGCKDVEVPSDRDPVGNLASAWVRKDLIGARGWARDPDTDQPIKVELTLDGERLRYVWADLGDPPAFFKMRMGYSLSPGAYEVCAIAQSFESAGPNRAIGCADVTVPEDWPPDGTLTAASADTNGVWVKGQAWDDDAPGPLEVRVKVDGSIVGTVLSDRGTLNRKYADTVPTPLTPGPHTVCTLAANHTGKAPYTELGCRTVEVAAP